MNLTHLRTFITLANTGNFRRAAERLTLSQPAVSQHLRRLEQQLGVSLVVRKASGCELTTQGRRFSSYAEAMLRLAERAVVSVRDERLVVGASSNVGTYVLQPSFKRFLVQQGQRLTADLQIGSNPAIVEWLETDQIDIAVMEWWDNRPGFLSYPWRKERLIVIAAPDHPWAAKREVTVAQLKTEPILGGEPGSGTARVLRDTLGAIADDLRISMKLGSTEAVKHGVRAGLGVSIVLESSVREELAASTLIHVRLRAAAMWKQLVVVHRSTFGPGSAAATFAKFLRHDPGPRDTDP